MRAAKPFRFPFDPYTGKPAFQADQLALAGVYAMVCKSERRGSCTELMGT